MTCFLKRSPYQRVWTVVLLLSWLTWVRKVCGCKRDSVQVTSFLSYISTWFFSCNKALILLQPYLLQKRQMFSIPLLDTFWLNKAKTNPAIDLFWTSEQGSQCSGLIFSGWGYELILQSVLPPLGVQNTIWHTEEVLEGWMTGSELVFLNIVWF